MKELLTVNNVIAAICLVGTLFTAYKARRARKVLNDGKAKVWENAFEWFAEVDEKFNGKPSEVKRKHWIVIARNFAFKHTPIKYRWVIDKFMSDKVLGFILDSMFTPYKIIEKDKKKEVEATINDIQEGLEKGE